MTMLYSRGLDNDFIIQKHHELNDRKYERVKIALNSDKLYKDIYLSFIGNHL